MQKILLIDNNDSFTYNLVQIFEENSCSVDVIENTNISGIIAESYSGIVISPGPGNPSDYHNLFEFLKNNFEKNKILGVCLGHQVIGEFFGAVNYRLEKVYHGERNQIKIIADSIIFNHLENYFPLMAGRYHSWALSNLNFPDSLKITSLDDKDVIMSMEHNYLPIFGVQFHLESIMTDSGEKIIRNWLNL